MKRIRVKAEVTPPGFRAERAAEQLPVGPPPRADSAVSAPAVAPDAALAVSATTPVVPPGSTDADPEREALVARLFGTHYASMLRLAALLGAEDPENIAAEAFYEIYRKWRKLRKPDAAEAYLRSVVCNLTRMQIRRAQVARKHTQNGTDDPAVSAETAALLRDDQQALVGALRALPSRQREALVLRHWMGLKEGEIAATMGISVGSVKTHTSRGLAALTQVMEVRR